MSKVMLDRNERLREEFNNWCERLYSPSLKVVSEKMGVPYSNLVRWRKGVKNFDIENVKKIERFINRELVV